MQATSTAGGNNADGDDEVRGVSLLGLWGVCAGGRAGWEEAGRGPIRAAPYYTGALPSSESVHLASRPP